METPLFHLIHPTDTKEIELIANWYFSEWNIPIQETVHHLSGFSDKKIPFQLLMTVNKTPVATGDIYTHVRLLDREPTLNVYGPWLALVLTKRGNRTRGYGKLLCEKIQDMTKNRGLNNIYLYTHTAESLYQKLGWQVLKRLTLNHKDIAVMQKSL